MLKDIETGPKKTLDDTETCIPGMGRSVAHFKPTDVSKVNVASIFKFKEEAEQETSMNKVSSML